jgi:hypothetical protein
MLQGVEMGRKHRGKPPNKVHERIAALPVNAVVARAVVDDPYEKGAHITVLRSLRDDPLARLLARKQIAQHQYEAGRAWQRDYEASEIGNVRGIDTTREAVDGGRMAEPLTEARQRAAKRINGALDFIGTDGMKILEDVLARRMTMKEVAGIRGWTTPQWEKYFGIKFRGHLEELAVYYGLADSK